MSSMALLEKMARVKEASYSLVFIEQTIKQKILLDIAHRLGEMETQIIECNQKDLSLLAPSDPKYDRLLLTADRIQAIAQSLQKIAYFESPVGKTLEETVLPNGLKLQKKTVPLGVIAIIYESRPNVTLDAFALCFMSSNACILKGGSDAKYSNEIFVKLIQLSLKKFAVPEEIILLFPQEREAMKPLFTATDLVDVLIPRGSQGLIDYVKQHAKVPVIETGAGVVHTYFDISGDKEKGKRIITNAKMRRVSVCNALDCLIIHQERLDVLPFLVSDLALHSVMIHADEPAFKVLQPIYPEKLLLRANAADYGKEFLAPELAIKTVNDVVEALRHIRHYSSKHSEAVIAEDKKVIAQFLEEVDAAVVYANVSTAFTDGEQFGMGGEIGISTQKLHVRGPFSMQHLVSTKWLVEGSGQIRG